MSARHQGLLISRFVVVTALLLPALAHAADKPSVGVLAISAEYGIDPRLSRVLTDTLAQSMRDSAVFGSVVAQDEIETMVGADRARQMGQCDSTGCQAELAGALGVDFLLSGNVSKIGTTYVINIKMLDVKKAVVAATVSQRISGEREEALLEGVAIAGVKLLKSAGYTPADAMAHQETVQASAPVTTQPAAAPVEKKLVPGTVAAGLTVLGVMFAAWGAISIAGYIPVLGWALFLLTPIVYGLVAWGAGMLGLRSARNVGNLDLPDTLAFAVVAPTVVASVLHVFTVCSVLAGLGMVAAGLSGYSQLLSLGIGVTALAVILNFLVDLCVIIAGPLLFTALIVPLSGN